MFASLLGRTQLVPLLVKSGAALDLQDNVCVIVNFCMNWVSIDVVDVISQIHPDSVDIFNITVHVYTSK